MCSREYFSDRYFIIYLEHIMMAETILVTDSVFIFDEHVHQLEQAGYRVERLDKPCPSEAELCVAIRGKVGYILGGVEQVTQPVLAAADRLRALSLVGVGYPHFIPVWQQALQQGVAISNTPGGPTNEAAEWSLAAALMMNRRFLELGLTGSLNFAVTPGIEGQTVGILGLGRIGTRIAELVTPFRPGAILYHNRQPHLAQAEAFAARYVSKLDLFAQADIIFVCLPGDAKLAVGRAELAAMKPGALLVSIAHPGVVDEPALYEVLAAGRIRAISDYPMKDVRYTELPVSHWFSMKQSNTISQAGARQMSDMATCSMLSLLRSGHDQFEVLLP